jgi:hypothetical protein
MLTLWTAPVTNFDPSCSKDTNITDAIDRLDEAIDQLKTVIDHEAYQWYLTRLITVVVFSIIIICCLQGNGFTTCLGLFIHLLQIFVQFGLAGYIGVKSYDYQNQTKAVHNQGFGNFASYMASCLLNNELFDIRVDQIQASLGKNMVLFILSFEVALQLT